MIGLIANIDVVIRKVIAIMHKYIIQIKKKLELAV